MRAICLLTMLFVGFFGHAQKETRNWFMHSNRAAVTSSGINTGLPFPPHGFNPTSASTSVSDSAGNLLFACDGNTIIDKNLTSMPTLELANVNFNAMEGVVMAQKIPNTSRYIVFYTKDNHAGGFINSSWTLKFAVVDMSLNGGDGDVITYNQVLDSRSSRGFTIVQGANTNNAWLVVHHNGTDSFFAFKITATGLQTTPVISKTGADTFERDYFFNDLKTSPNGSMIGGIIYRIYSAGNSSFRKTFVEIYDFNPQTGQLNSHVRSLQILNVHDFLSVDFSPDNRLFYVCLVEREDHAYPCGFGYGTVIQFNTCYTDSLDFTHYSMYVAEHYSRCFPLSTWGTIQLGADKKIHMPFTGTAVSTISNPNRIGTSCNYIFNSYYLPNDNDAYDVAPHFQHRMIEKPVKNNILYHGGCYPNRTFFSISNDTINNVNWNFGDPTSSNNSSTLPVTSHVFSAPGIYTVTASVFNSQLQLIDTLSELVEIKNPNIRLLHGYPTDTSFCEGGQLNFHLTGVNAVFYWHNTSTDNYEFFNSSDSFIIASSGTYIVEMHQSDCDGCTMIDSIHVEVKPKPDLNLGPDRNLCAGDSIKIGVHAPGAALIWNTGEIGDSIWIHSPGLYWVQGEYHFNGCPSRDSINITGVPALQFSLPADTTLCENQTLLLNPAVPNATYIWQNQSTDSSQVVHQPGMYWVQVTSQFGCVKADTVLVQYFNPNFFLGNDTTLCEGQSLTLTANVANAQYHWSNGSTASQITVNQTGDYWLTVSNGHCFKTDTIKIIFHSKPNLFLGNDTIICPYDKLTLYSGNPGATHLWQNGSSADSFVVTQPGLYWLQIQQFGCTVKDSINIWHYSVPLINIGPDKSFCSGDSLLLVANNGFSQYAWNNGSTSQQIFVHAVGQYSVTGITNSGCKVSDTMEVTDVYHLPLVNLNHDQTLCTGDSRVLDAGAGFASYLWSNSSTTRTITVNTAGLYSVVVVDHNGCRGGDAVDINTLLPAPKNFLPADTAICSYESISIQSSQLYREYLWSTSALTRKITVDPGLYWLQVTDNHNCKGIDSIFIDTKKCIEGLYVPSGFTPNNDGKNDLLKPFLFGKAKQFTFTIYNRWGLVVFQTTQPGKGWDGKLNGQMQDANVYIWICSYQLEGQKPMSEKGTLVLIH